MHPQSRVPEKLSDRDWKSLLRRIRDGKCTPFLGAGAAAGCLPVARDIAQQWAAEYDYPLADGDDDLARVAQFIAVEVDDMAPKEDLAELLSAVDPPDFSAPDEIHRVLADLPLPIYITTNYDAFMMRALKYRKKEPRRELCQWNGYVKRNFDSVFDQDRSYTPAPATPLVYHLHGAMDMAQSMVLTEDDYLDFLVSMSRDVDLLPHPIMQALSGSSLLFVGYSRSDWNFRVLFRGLIESLDASLNMTSVAVQLPPLPADTPQPRRERVQAYLERYFENIQKIPVRVYWGTAAEFAAELHQRWEAFKDG
jgi:hypothetical protein